MILNNNVHTLKKNINTSKEHLIVRFDLDLEFFNDKLIDNNTFYVEFDENGHIFNIPNIDIKSDNPLRHIPLSKAVEAILDYQGDRAKTVYDKAMLIKNEYERKRAEYINNSGYNDLVAKSVNIDMKLHNALSKTAKNTKDSKAMKSCIDILIDEKNQLHNNKIIPIEVALTKLELEKSRAISELKIV